MKVRISLILLVVFVLGAGVVSADQIRLRNGHLLQCEIVNGKSNENFLAVKLFSTGGEFMIKWEHLIPEDEDRLRDTLGLKPWSETEVPMIDGHEVIFKTGALDSGLVLNEAATAEPLRMKKATGMREFARNLVAKVRPMLTPITAVYSADELYARFLEELSPGASTAEPPVDPVTGETAVDPDTGEPLEGYTLTGPQHKALAESLMQVEGYAMAQKHYRKALEDPDLPEDIALEVRNRLVRVDILVLAADAVEQVREIKRMRSRKKFDEAIQSIEELEEKYAEKPAITKELHLDTLKRRITADRKKYYTREVMKKFYRVFKQLVGDKVKNREATINEVLVWALNPKGLKTEIFDKIADSLGLESAEARDLWKNRTSKQVRRYSYGTGTFLHPEVAAKTKKMAQPRRRSTRNAGRSGGSRRPQQKAEKPKTKDEWWKFAKAKVRENFVKAWFAEFEPEVLEVLRVESRNCQGCGGKGVTYATNAMGGEKTKHICKICNLAGHERIVICR